MADIRVKHAAVMCCIWLIIIAISAAYVLRDASTEVLFGVMIFVVTSGVFQLLGAAVYAGDYRGLAGFSHMTDAHIAEYEGMHDMKGMTAFLGISFMVSSYVMFFVYVLSRGTVGELWGIMLSIAATVILLISVSVYSAGKRFRTAPGEHGNE